MWKYEETGNLGFFPWPTFSSYKKDVKINFILIIILLKSRQKKDEQHCCKVLNNITWFYSCIILFCNNHTLKHAETVDIKIRTGNANPKLDLSANLWTRIRIRNFNRGFGLFFFMSMSSFVRLFVICWMI